LPTANFFDCRLFTASKSLQKSRHFCSPQGLLQGSNVAKIRVWSALASLELLRLLRQQPYQLFRLTVMATIVGAVAVGYAWSGPKAGIDRRDLEAIAEWLAPSVALALLLATYFCFPMILSTALLERGAESPTMLLRLTRLSGREILLVKLLAGMGAFVYACLPAAVVLGFAFALAPVIGLLAFLLILAFLLWTMIHVGLIVLAFSVSATRAADAYRRSLFAFVMLWFIPFAAPGGGFLAGYFESWPWSVQVPLNLWLSLLLPWLAFKRAGRQLDDPDGLVGLNYTPAEEVQASAPIEWAQWLFGKFLLILAIGLTIPMMSVTAYYLQDALEDGRLASWLFIQIPATIILLTMLTLRLTFSNYFEPTGAMYALLLAAPTSPAWWFGKLLLVRSRAVLGALAFFGAAALLSVQVEAERRMPILALIVLEVIQTTLWVFVLTVVCRPRFLALPALLCYLFLTYFVPLMLPEDVGRLPWYALAVAAAVSLVTLRWPHPALIVAQASAWAYSRNLVFAVIPRTAPSPPHKVTSDVFTALYDLLTAGSRGRWWGTSLGTVSVTVPGFPGTEGARALVVGDILVLVVTIVWLRWAFDAMVGRTTPRIIPRIWTRGRSHAHAANG